MKIGLVGYGTGGQNFHAPYICAAQGVELAGIVARAPATIARVKADFPEVPVYPSLTAMLAAGVDIVTITTPPETRRELVLQAIDAGVAVIADKPFAPDAQTGRELAAAAQVQGFAIMLGCMLCTSRAIRAALPLVTQARFVDLDGPTWLAVDADPVLPFSCGRIELSRLPAE